MMMRASGQNQGVVGRLSAIEIHAAVFQATSRTSAIHTRVLRCPKVAPVQNSKIDGRAAQRQRGI
jgi:hypothetical protein